MILFYQYTKLNENLRIESVTKEMNKCRTDKKYTENVLPSGCNIGTYIMYFLVGNVDEMKKKV